MSVEDGGAGHKSEEAKAREAERQRIREQRLAAALRENLMRRKAQTRARASDTSPPKDAATN